MNKETKKILGLVSNVTNFFDDNGGKITFQVKFEKDGWSAQCREQTSIMTGGNEINPNEELVQSKIKELLGDVFNLPEGILEFEFSKEGGFLVSPYYSIKDRMVVCEQ